MGFDIIGPTRHVRASNIDDGEEPRYDILSMPREYGLNCPQIEKLNQRFYESTTLAFERGDVSAFRDELAQLARAHRTRRETELKSEHRVRAKDPGVRAQIVEGLLQQDATYHVIEELRMLCEEAIVAEADVQCIGD